MMRSSKRAFEGKYKIVTGEVRNCYRELQELQIDDGTTECVGSVKEVVVSLLKRIGSAKGWKMTRLTHASYPNGG